MLGAIIAVVIVVEHGQIVVMRVYVSSSRFAARLALFEFVVQRFFARGGSRSGRFGGAAGFARRAFLARFPTGTAATTAATAFFGRRFAFCRGRGGVRVAVLNFGQRLFDKVRFVVRIGREVRLFVTRQSFDFRARGALRDRARGTIALYARWTIATLFAISASSTAATTATSAALR